MENSEIDYTSIEEAYEILTKETKWSSTRFTISPETDSRVKHIVTITTPDMLSEDEFKSLAELNVLVFGDSALNLVDALLSHPSSVITFVKDDNDKIIGANAMALRENFQTNSTPEANKAAVLLFLGMVHPDHRGKHLGVSTGSARFIAIEQGIFSTTNTDPERAEILNDLSNYRVYTNIIPPSHAVRTVNIAHTCGWIQNEVALKMTTAMENVIISTTSAGIQVFVMRGEQRYFPANTLGEYQVHPITARMVQEPILRAINLEQDKLQELLVFLQTVYPTDFSQILDGTEFTTDDINIFLGEEDHRVSYMAHGTPFAQDFWNSLIQWLDTKEDWAVVEFPLPLESQYDSLEVRQNFSTIWGQTSQTLGTYYKEQSQYNGHILLLPAFHKARLAWSYKSNGLDVATPE